MGKFVSSYASSHSQVLADRIVKPAAAPKVPVAQSKVVQVEQSAIAPATAMRSRKAAVSDAVVDDASKPKGTSVARTARWRAKQDPDLLKLRNREAVRAHRARQRPKVEGK